MPSSVSPPLIIPGYRQKKPEAKKKRTQSKNQPKGKVTKQPVFPPKSAGPAHAKASPMASVNTGNNAAKSSTKFPESTLDHEFIDPVRESRPG